MRLRCLIVDDNAHFRDEVCGLLGKEPLPEPHRDEMGRVAAGRHPAPAGAGTAAGAARLRRRSSRCEYRVEGSARARSPAMRASSMRERMPSLTSRHGVSEALSGTRTLDALLTITTTPP
jgi:hypothetical protein